MLGILRQCVQPDQKCIELRVVTAKVLIMTPIQGLGLRWCEATVAGLLRTQVRKDYRLR